MQTEIDWKEEARRLRLECIDWAGKHQEQQHLIDDLETNINLKADFIDATINQLADADQQIAELKEQLRRCFSGETISVRNEILMQVLEQETERVLAIPQEDIREYLSRKFD